MTPKHAPGPWRVETWNYGKSTGAERAVPTVIANRDAVAQALDLWPPDERQAERDANAHLIAAAPDMRDMLDAVDHALTNMLQTFGDRSLADLPRERVQITRDEIRTLLARVGGVNKWPLDK